MKRITVIGTGYLGAVHAASMASLGYEVLGMDVNSEKIAALAAGRPPFFEPGFDEHKYECLQSMGGKDRSSSLQEGVSYIYT